MAARGLHQLTARQVEALKQPGRHADGGLLFLDITKTGSKSWALFYRSPVHRTTRTGADGKVKTAGRQREMGLGAFGNGKGGTVSLAQAREKAADARALIATGKDPLDERALAAAPVVAAPTFGEVADALIASMASGWKNEKHLAQWEMTLREYAAPLRPKLVDEITVTDVLECLKPHWEQRPETADRLRGRIERVLNAAKAQGHRAGENPAAWRGHLENLLPKRQKLLRGHHSAMAWQDVPAFVAALRKRQGVAALALEFIILTAVRSGEGRGARWAEFDFDAKVWTIPRERMKADAEHRVPLTPRMLAILDTVKPLADPEGLVFPGQQFGRPLSDMTLAAVMKRMKVEGVTVHGFRSSFRDWCGSATSYPREIAEEALAHAIGSKVERAYRRQDALERRRELMAAWEKFVEAPAGGNVVPLMRTAG